MNHVTSTLTMLSALALWGSASAYEGFDPYTDTTTPTMLHPAVAKKPDRGTTSNMNQAVRTPSAHARDKSRVTHHGGPVSIPGSVARNGSSSQRSAVVAAPCKELGATAEAKSAIDAGFYVCVLNGLAQGAAVERIEDKCAPEPHVALAAKQSVDEDNSSQRAEVEVDSWSEFESPGSASR